MENLISRGRIVMDIKELAEKAGFSQITIRDYENELQQFTDLILEEASKIFNETIKGLEEEIENYRLSY